MSSYRETELAELVQRGHTPKHVAIIMDGNGRWAKKRGLPRFAGHKFGVESVRKVVSACGDHGVEVLTLFAFSSENWRRPEKEVGVLMELFLTALKHEVKKLNRNNVRLRVVGGLEAFSDKLRARITEAEEMTAGNSGLTLVICANYGGRWDIMQATQRLYADVAAGKKAISEITENDISQYLCLADLPEPDLFIRTGGEERISNFLLWQLAYTELYFTETLWPDFDKAAFADALLSFAGRQRRFGRTGEQVEKVAGA